MTKKIFTILTLLLLTTSSLFAESIGFTSVHSGFWWWVGAVAICIISLMEAMSLGGCLFDWISIPTATFVGVLSGIFSILGFWVIPCVWCSLLFCNVGAIIGCSVLYCGITCTRKYEEVCVHRGAIHSTYETKLVQEVDPHAWVLSSLVCALAISAEVFVMIFLPNNWWIWKYFAVAVLGSGIANILAIDSHHFEQRKPTLILTICLITDFIAFWIVFGICGWNVFSVILGIIFCLLVFVSLISPFICMIIKKVQKDMKEFDEAWAAVQQVKKLAKEIARDPKFIESHPEYKDFYEYYKKDIDEWVQIILKKQYEEDVKKINEEQAQKKAEREEEARETAFQKSLKSISEDIDAIELSVGKGEFNIQQLTILENHISVLCENKSILTENNKNSIQRKKKYLEAIFEDCKKLPECKGSAKVRIEEILAMLDELGNR